LYPRFSSKCICQRIAKQERSLSDIRKCLGNVGARPRGDLYLTRVRPDQKIDAAVALMTAIGRTSEEDPNVGLDGFFADPLTF
jgi:hypothetical protein